MRFLRNSILADNRRTSDTVHKRLSRTSPACSPWIGQTSSARSSCPRRSSDIGKWWYSRSTPETEEPDNLICDLVQTSNSGLSSVGFTAEDNIQWSFGVEVRCWLLMRCLRLRFVLDSVAIRRLLSTPVRLQLERAATNRRPTSRPDCCTAA